MNRILVSLCFLMAACGEVVPVDGAAVDGGNVVDGDGGTDTDAGLQDRCAGPNVALGDLETCFRRMQCEFMVRCFPGFPDVQFCESRIFDFFSLQQESSGGEGDDGPSKLFFEIIARAAAANVTTYDGGRAFRCLESLRDASCKSNGGNDECEYIISGALAEDEDCYDDFQCQPGASCNGDGLSCDTIGRCENGLPLGADCADGQRCLPELECVFVADGSGGSGGSLSCQDGKANAQCNDDFECKPEFYCQSNTCVPDVAAGGTCTQSAQCPGDEVCIDTFCSRVSVAGDDCRDTCFGNLYCDTTTTACTPMPAQGELCGQVPATSLSRCGDVDTVCGGAAAQRCILRIPAGAPCGGPGISSCALGSFCSSELEDVTPDCTAPQAEGAGCSAAKHCSSGFCTLESGSQSCSIFQACWE